MMQIVVPSTFGRVLRDRRKALGLTQRDLAELADCAERLVHEVENGKSTVRMDRLLAILRVLGLQLTLGKGKDVLVVPNGE